MNLIIAFFRPAWKVQAWTGIRTLTSAMPVQCKMTLLTPNQFDRLMFQCQQMGSQWEVIRLLCSSKRQITQNHLLWSWFRYPSVGISVLGRLLKLPRKLRLHFAWRSEHNSEFFQTMKKKKNFAGVTWSVNTLCDLAGSRDVTEALFLRGFFW